MKVNEIMSRGIRSVDVSAKLNVIADKMKNFDIGVLGVYEEGRLVGLVTDRDVVVRGLAESRNLDLTGAEDIMSSNIVYCHEDDDLEQAAQVMEDKQLHRLVVVNDSEKPVGILSLGDLAAKAHRDELVGEIVERITEPLAKHS